MNKTSIKGEWTTNDLEINKNWLIELDDNDNEELVKATQFAVDTNKNLYDLTSSDFPLKYFVRKINLIKEQIQSGFGFVVIKKLPIKQFNEEEVKRMLWGIGQYIGYPEKQDRAGALLHVVTDTGANFSKSDHIRGFQTNEELQFHTDGADIFALLCIRNAKTGGLSKLVSSVAIFNEIEKVRPDLAQILQKEFHFDSRTQNPNDDKIQKIPIFVKHDNLITALYKRRYIRSAQRFEEVPKLTKLQIEALDLIDKLCNDKKFCLSMQLSPGDLEIASNATTFHSRETYEDYADPNKRRCMIRLWLSLLHQRPLPQVYKRTREWEPTFKRRGLMN
tara:strand:- start:1604 stop:2605 length:1002 start_codon:yes stop_codon:yes gene_type:complete